MQPNDLPIVCLPLELSDEAAAEVLGFLHNLTEAFESHYAGQLLRHNRTMRPPPQQSLPLEEDGDPF